MKSIFKILSTLVFVSFCSMSQATIRENTTAVDILKIKKSHIDGEVRVTLRIPKTIRSDVFVTCEYYNKSSEIIASTSHALLKRTPTWGVEASKNDIYFVLCGN